MYINKAGQLARDIKVDIVIGIGGGSTLDTAKGVTSVEAGILAPDKIRINKRDLFLYEANLCSA